MTPNGSNSLHQPETEFRGEIQTFAGPALAPDDPSLEPRARKGRPHDANDLPSANRNDPAEQG